MNPLHSKASKRWGTPEDIILRARKVMGGIDLDPASEDRFQKVVCANQWYSLEDRGEDGLSLPWSGKIFCNPPGQLVREFWKKAFSEDIEQMIWVGFSVEQLCTLIDDDFVHPLDFSTCLLRKRIRFTRHDGYSGSPSHGNYICGINTFPDDFELQFGDLGKIIHGRYAHSTIPKIETP